MPRTPLLAIFSPGKEPANSRNIAPPGKAGRPCFKVAPAGKIKAWTEFPPVLPAAIRPRFAGPKGGDTMPLVRWTPFREMLDMPREMRRVFGRPLSLLDEPGFEMMNMPPMDVFSKGGDMIVRLEMPGINADDLDISLSEHTLRISGERRSDKEVKEGDYYRHERSYGRFERSLPVPEKVTEKDIDADYADGILEIKVKNAVEEIPAKKIEVKTGSGAKRIRAKRG